VRARDALNRCAADSGAGIETRKFAYTCLTPEVFPVGCYRRAL
jgi:hypothetical protein